MRTEEEIREQLESAQRDTAARCRMGLAKRPETNLEQHNFHLGWQAAVEWVLNEPKEVSLKEPGA